MKLNKGFFVIGTDTDIGKTYVSTLLYKGIKELNGGYFKPVQSGCFDKNGILTAPDVDYLCKFNDIPYDKDMVGYTLKAEVSPHLAAELENIDIDPEIIMDKWSLLKDRYKYMIVEGAGGLYVPLVRGKLYIYDIIKMMNLPVILVSSAKVGSINHAILTVDNLRNMGIDIHGIVFNKVTGDSKNYYEEDNIRVILELSKLENYLIIKSGENEIENSRIREFLGMKGRM